MNAHGRKSGYNLGRAYYRQLATDAVRCGAPQRIYVKFTPHNRPRTPKGKAPRVRRRFAADPRPSAGHRTTTWLRKEVGPDSPYRPIVEALACEVERSRLRRERQVRRKINRASR